MNRICIPDSEYLERVKKVFKEKLGLDFYTKPMVGGCSDGNIIKGL